VSSMAGALAAGAVSDTWCELHDGPLVVGYRANGPNCPVGGEQAKTAPAC